MTTKHKAYTTPIAAAPEYLKQADVMDIAEISRRETTWLTGRIIGLACSNDFALGGRYLEADDKGAILDAGAFFYRLQNKRPYFDLFFGIVDVGRAIDAIERLIRSEKRGPVLGGKVPAAYELNAIFTELIHRHIHAQEGYQAAPVSRKRSNQLSVAA